MWPFFKVIRPDGHQVTRISCPYASNAAEPGYIVARITGFYRVRVGALGKFALPGSYKLRIVEIRPARPQDEKKAEAQRLLVEGNKLIEMRGS
jgi:hypothetical protein